MKLSIIIVNYKTAALTKTLIESLLSDTLPQGTEIIVVDNNSGDDSVFLLRSDFPEITVIDNKENTGLSGGTNTAIEYAGGAYYLILNPDMVAIPGSVKTLVDYMDANSDVGISAGKLLSPSGELQYSSYRFYTPATIFYRRTWLGKTEKGQLINDRFLMKDFDHESEKDVDWLMGSCLMVRAKAAKEVGGMDERFFLYFEDVDWCRRMWEKGWRVVYVPSASFSHFHQRSSEGGSLLSLFTNRAVREHIKSAVKYFLKFGGRKFERGE